MHWWQWTVLVLLLIVAVLLLDGAFRTLLRGDVTVTELDGRRDRSTLIVYLPGLVADGEWSARQLTDTWRQFGDVWLVNPTGARFEHKRLAEKLASMLTFDGNRRVVFIGSSLGAFNALDIVAGLSRRKQAETLFYLVPVCSPTQGVHDIKQPLKFLSGVAAVFRFGPATNATWGRLYTRLITGRQPRSFAMTYYIDQVNYVRSRPAPDREVLRRFRVLYLQASHDEIITASAAWAWVGNGRSVVAVDSKHVAYDADPKKWDKAFRSVLGLLLMH